jgi:hypothetical protein
MNLPNTPAIARLSTILGVDIPARIRDMVNPFIISLPTPVDVEPTEGSYSMLFDTPHVRIATGTSAVQVVFPEPAYENKGRMFTVDVYQEEGGLASVEAVFPDESTQTLAAGIRHQFISANANAWMSVGGTGASAGFDFTFPDQVEVQMETPDPPENAGTYTMTSAARNILVTETAGGQSYAVVVLPAAELGSACRVAVSAGQKACVCLGPAPENQHLGVVHPGSPPVDFLPYGDGKYCAVTDMVQFESTLAYLIGSASDTPSPTGKLWARVLHLQERSRCHYTVGLSSVIAEDSISVGGDTLTAVAADPAHGEFLVGATDTDTAEALADAINDIEGVTATSNGASVSVYGPVFNLIWSVSSHDVTFAIEPANITSLLVFLLGSLDDRITALENQGA